MFAVVGPEILAVVGEGASLEGDVRDVGDFRRGGTRIDAGEPVVVGIFGVGRHEVDEAFDINLTADAVGHVDRARDLTGLVEGEEFFRIPLADSHSAPIIAEL